MELDLFQLILIATHCVQKSVYIIICTRSENGAIWALVLLYLFFIFEV